MNMLRRFTDFVLLGRIQACAIAFVLAYVPIVGSISILMAGLVTLRKGALEGGLVFLTATVPYFLSYYSAPASVTAEASLALPAIVMVAASHALMWSFAVILRRYSSWGFILDLVLLLGVMIIGMIHFLYPAIQDWWNTQLLNYFNKTAVIMTEMQPNATVMPPEVLAQLVNKIKVYATGLLIVSVMFHALLQLLIARWWQAAMFNPGALRKELLHIRLSYVSGALFLICYSLSIWGNETAIDMMPVVYLILSAAGLSLFHCLLAKRVPLIWRFFLYVGSLLIIIRVPGAMMNVALFLSVIALFDIGVDVRKRLMG